MTVCPNSHVDTNNKLICRWHCPCHGFRVQRKRLSSSIDPFVRQVQEIYRNKSAVFAVKHIMIVKDLKLAEAFRMFNFMRGVQK